MNNTGYWEEESNNEFEPEHKRFNLTKTKLTDTSRADILDSKPSTLDIRTNTNKHHPKVTESENIEANHLEFAKSLFQYYCQYLGLNPNHISTESAFNFYVNKKISFLLGTPVNMESARETFYRKLIQNTNLPTNYNFAFIITEINKEIEHHIQQRYPITYTSKDKKKLQTPAKTRVESPTNPSYHYIPKSAINILSTGTNQRKTELLGPYKLSEEEEKKELKDQEFTYQNPITKNSEVETLNLQTQQNLNLKNPKIKTLNIQPPPNQNNQNPNLINQLDLLPVIVINSPPVELIGQPPQQSHQQIQQPLVPFQQPLQPNLDPMAYAPIAKLEKFTGKEDDAQAWINDIAKAITTNNWDDARTMQVIPYFLKDTTDSWYYSLAQKPQNFNAFKLEFLRYFSDNNSINHLASTFTTIKQRDTEAVTTYLGHFHKNLHQIQAIQADYFTQVHLMHPVDLPTAMTHARDFEAAELEANHAQAMNLVMNGSSNLDSKLKQFSDNINQKLESYLADNCAIYQPLQ
ncbi:hypothetical protein G9A89_008995 [Geosiphon pyriformis]|nr:hypothetical protein G9A89_008995 [Geosiphon pyriformis]